MLINADDASTPPELRDKLVELCRFLKETATDNCAKEAWEHKDIASYKSVNSSKASDLHFRFGDMVAAGYGGGKVGQGDHSKKLRNPGRKFYKETFNPSMGELAHRICVLANEVEAHKAAKEGREIPKGQTLVDKLFVRKAHFLLQVDYPHWLRLAHEGGAACFATLNFSHDRYYAEEDNVKDVFHGDSQDQSQTFLVLHQHPDTPDEHRAHWFDESTGEFIPVSFILLHFNGRLFNHALIPPKVISMDPKHAWFGATVLMKHILKGEKKPKQWRTSKLGPRKKKSKK